MKKSIFLKFYILTFLIFSPLIKTYGLEEFSNKIPTAYVIVSGFGESNKGILPHPNETFSYDLALQKAGIENFNVITYTSILPLESYEVAFSDVQKYFHHGAVLEAIMARTSGKKGETIVAGIGRIWAQDKNGKDIGGFAAEYERIYKSTKINAKTIKEDAKKQLIESLEHILKIRGLKQKGEMKFDITFSAVNKKYATALVAIGFINYKYPKPIPTIHTKKR